MINTMSEQETINDSKLCVLATGTNSTTNNGMTNIVGEIKLNINDPNKLIMSQSAKILLQYTENKNKLASVDNIIEKIQNVIACSVFSSKRMGTDEFTDIYYDSDHDHDNDSDCEVDGYNYLVYKLINGSGSFVRYPGGNIIYHTSNQILFDCLNIEYMIDNKCIPLSLTDLDTNKIYNVTRSSGDTHLCKIFKNSSLRISSKKNELYIYLLFRDDGIDPNDETTYSDFREKEISLELFMKLNNITNITLTKPELNFNNYKFLEDYFISNKLIDEIILHYNTKLNEHINGIAASYFKFVGSTEIIENTIKLIK